MRRWTIFYYYCVVLHRNARRNPGAVHPRQDLLRYHCAARRVAELVAVTQTMNDRPWSTHNNKPIFENADDRRLLLFFVVGCVSVSSRTRA